jgi:hypothetical protein
MLGDDTLKLLLKSRVQLPTFLFAERHTSGDCLDLYYAMLAIKEVIFSLWERELVRASPLLHPHECIGCVVYDRSHYSRPRRID